MKKKLLSLAIVGALVTSCMSSSVFAATNSTALNENSLLLENQEISKESTMEVIDVVTIFGAYVEFNSSGEVYLTKTASEIGVSQEKYDEFMKGIQLENEAIKSGELSLVFDENGKVIDVTTNLDIKVVKQNQSTFMPSKISVKNHWYGWQLKLSETETSNLAKALGVGSGAAWLAAELSAAGYITIPASIPLGIIAASGGLAAATIIAVDQGKGISIYYNVGTSIGWIWPN